MRCARALREDPDAILVGEMRDLETIRLALTAAETGHLVFGTLHTSQRGQDHRPGGRRVPRGREGDGARDAVGVADRRDLADAVQARKTAAGRVAAHEIMLGTAAIRNLIRESQDRADVLFDPDRQQRWACRRWTRTSPTWCAETWSRRPKRAPRPSFRKTSLGKPGTQRDRRHGTRSGIQIRQRPAAADGQSRNGSDLFLTADFPPAIKVDGKVTKVSPQPLTGAAHAGAGALGDERQAGRRVRAHQGVQLRDLAAGHRALPRATPSCSRATSAWCCGRFRRRCRPSTAEPAAGAQGRRDDQARPGHLRRRHRLGQEHLAGGDGRLPQRELARPHHHDRGPGRVRAPAQELHHHAARGRHRHRRLGAGAEEHAAPGAPT